MYDTDVGSSEPLSDTPCRGRNRNVTRIRRRVKRRVVHSESSASDCVADSFRRNRKRRAYVMKTSSPDQSPVEAVVTGVVGECLSPLPRLSLSPSSHISETGNCSRCVELNTVVFPKLVVLLREVEQLLSTVCDPSLFCSPSSLSVS